MKIAAETLKSWPTDLAVSPRCLSRSNRSDGSQASYDPRSLLTATMEIDVNRPTNGC